MSQQKLVRKNVVSLNHTQRIQIKE